MDKNISKEDNHRIILNRGAEAFIYLENNYLIKSRVSKDYRHPDLDFRLNKSRTRKEAKILNKLSNGNEGGNAVNVPKVHKVHENRGEIFMEKITNSVQALDFLLRFAGNNSNSQILIKEVMYKMGIQVRKMHNLNYAHGDLTTMNFLIKFELLSNEKDLSSNEKGFNNQDNLTDISNDKDNLSNNETDKDNLSNNETNQDNLNEKVLNEIEKKLNQLNVNEIVKYLKVYLIDFGLSYFTQRLEDISVDLWLFEKSIDCTHDLSYREDFYQGYYSLGEHPELVKKLESTRMRGRKRE